MLMLGQQMGLLLSSCCPVLVTPFGWWYMQTAADATKTTDAPRRAARAEPVAAASDKPATASTTTVSLY